MVTSFLTPKQQAKIKSPIIDINNCLNEVLSSFDFLNIKLSSGFRLVDIFSDFFSFTSVNCNNIDVLKTHHFRLDRIYKDFLNNQDTILIIADTSIKNNITTLVFHIQKSHNIINKFVHHAMNINSTEAKLFVIRCRIDQATKIYDASKIIIIIDAISAMKQIFDTLVHPYRLYIIVRVEDSRL